MILAGDGVVPSISPYCMIQVKFKNTSKEINTETTCKMKEISSRNHHDQHVSFVPRPLILAVRTSYDFIYRFVITSKGTRNILYGQEFLRRAAIGPDKKKSQVSGFFFPTWKDETIIFLFNRQYFSHKIFEYLRQEKNTAYNFYFSRPLTSQNYPCRNRLTIEYIACALRHWRIKMQSAYLHFKHPNILGMKSKVRGKFLS